MKEYMEYHIFNPRDTGFPKELNLRNSCYNAWFQLWDAVYSKSDSDYKLKSEEFVRQNIVTAILVNGKVAALHLYSFYLLDSLADRKTHYFEFFSDTYIQKLKARGVKSVMSMEFLTVVPEFQKINTGVSLGRVIGGMGTRIFAESKLDAIVAPARRDLKVHDMAYDVGFDCIESKVVHRGFECDMIACFQGNQHRSQLETVNELGNYLWDKREIHGSAERYLLNKTNTTSQRVEAA